MNIKRTKFNLSLLGETTVGKTTMIQVKCGMPFNEDQLATVGIDNLLEKVKFGGKEYKFKIFDTAGQERYSQIASSTIKVADGFVLVFAVNLKSSFDRITLWIKSIEENANIKEKAIILVGNKIDMPNREVSKEDAENLAKNYNIKYFETSAKTGEGIQETFNQVYKDIYELNVKLDALNNSKPSDANMNNNGSFELKKENHKKNNKKSKKCC